MLGGIGCRVVSTVSHGDSQKTLAESLFTSQLSCAQEKNKRKLRRVLKGLTDQRFDGHSRSVRMKTMRGPLVRRESTFQNGVLRVVEKGDCSRFI